MPPRRSSRHDSNQSNTVRRKRRGPLRRYFRALRDPKTKAWKKILLAFGGLFVIGMIPVVGLAVYVAMLIPTTPSALELQHAAEARPSIVYAASGEKLTQFEAPFREWVSLDNIPLHVVDALLATEDRKFYDHNGIDIPRTMRAVWRSATGNREGGSTITQQLARNLFPDEIGRTGTIKRKIREMIAAVKIERAHTKRDILEAYVNTVPFLYNATGVERAAQTYFSKPATQLTVSEGATLVAMLKGPDYYNPVRNPDRARARRNLVLRLMAEQGDLDAAEAERLAGSDLGLNFRHLPGYESLAPHFTAAVRVRMEAWAERNGYNLETDGLVIHTTLDLDMQRVAEQAVREQAERLQAVADVEWSSSGMPSLAGADAYTRYRARVEPFGYFWRTRARVVERHIRRSDDFRSVVESGRSDEEAIAELSRNDAYMDSLRAIATRLEAGFVALEPSTGDVRAWVGSRDFAIDEYDHVAVARRQPGSTFKPFVYAAALQRGYSPLDLITDEAVTINLGGGRTWRATNSGSLGSGAELTLADGLAYSKNTITVQLMDEIGPARVALLAREMGISDSDLDPVPSLALGTSPVTLLEMVSAYGTIANEGLRRVPRLVTRVESASGHVLETFGGQGRQALTRSDARTLVDMMRGVVDRGTGRGIRDWGVAGDVAGKTGTTQANADGWFILMHPSLVAGSWVGFNDQQVAFRSNYWGQGAHNALFVVGHFFREYQSRLPDSRFADPPNYGQPLAANYDDQDSLLQWIDRHFQGDSAGYEPLEDLRFDDFEHTEFDAEAYEETFGRSEEVEAADPYERLQNATLADDPSIVDPVEPDIRPIPQRGSGRDDGGG